MKTIHSVAIALLMTAGGLTLQAANAQLPGVGRVVAGLVLQGLVVNTGAANHVT